MDFGALPPEVSSGRIYVGPGPATLLAASAGWDALAAELHSAADGYQAVVTGLTDESWTGPSSMSMVAAVAPYLQWMRTAAVQCEEAATRATAAAAAYETAFAMTVPPPAIVANRVRLATLIATNFLGQNTPAIAVTEAEYSEMWAQDATAMYNYAASAASASAFKVFTSPPQTTNPSGLVAQAGPVGRAIGSKAQTASTRLMSAVTRALHQLASPGSSSGTRLSLASSSASAPAGGLSSPTGFGGIGTDMYGTGLDIAGVDSLTGLGAAPSLGAAASLDGWGAVGSPWAGFDGEASADLGQAIPLGTLSVPPSWADALSVATPEPVLDANVMPGGWGAMPSVGTGSGSKLPSGTMVGRASGGAVQRIGFRASLIPNSPVAG
jgi:PPE-repeat protein